MTLAVPIPALTGVHASPVDFLPPAIADLSLHLTGLYTFGGDPDRSSYNFANAALPLLASGSGGNPDPAPAVSTLGTQLGGAVGPGASRGMYYDTQTPNPTAMTVIAVCKPLLVSSEHAGQNILANYFGGGAGGDTIGFGYQGGASAFHTYANTPTGVATGAALSLTGYSGSNYAAFGATISNSAAWAYGSYNGAVTSNGTSLSSGGGHLTDARPMLIGADYAMLYTGSISSLVMLATLNVEATSAQMADIFAGLRTWGATLGITTL